MTSQHFTLSGLPYEQWGMIFSSSKTAIALALSNSTLVCASKLERLMISHVAVHLDCRDCQIVSCNLQRTSSMLHCRDFDHVVASKVDFRCMELLPA